MHKANVELCANAKTEYHPMRCGAHHQGLAPYGVFKGKEGWIAILAGELQWPGLPRAMGQSELIEDGVIIPGFPIKSSELPNLPELWTSFRGEDNKAVL